jgi:hypothetical protein
MWSSFTPLDGEWSKANEDWSTDDISASEFSAWHASQKVVWSLSKGPYNQLTLTLTVIIPA